MADTAAEVPTRRSRSKRALKDKNSSTNESANTITTKVSEFTPPISEQVIVKENLDTSTTVSQPKKGRAASKKQSTKQQQQQSPSSFEKELLEMQEKLQQLHLEKEKTEELLKAKDEALKLKDQELENRGKEQEKLQTELKKLQKLKEFKPTMNLPLPKDKEQDKKDKKKRPSAPYILWCKDQWNEIKKTNSEAEFKDISNMLGAKWKTVSAEEKKPYEEKYNAEKEAYMEVMAKEKRETEALKLLEEDQKQKMAMELLEQYMQFRQETEKETTKKNKKEKDPLKPKHPMSAYILFTNDRRAALVAENKSVVEVAKITGEEWKNMTEEQKRPYEEMAKKKKEQYVQEMEAYKQRKHEEAANLMKEEEEHMKLQKQEALQLLKKKEKTEILIKKTKQKKKQNKEDKNSDPNRPKRPPSSFLLFSKEARKALHEERPGINISTLNALISLKWKELSEEDRQMWNGKASEAMEVYKKELEEYNKTIATSTEE
ncbi:high mobility group B protein 6-like [Arachis stenosperma]|uniref:high mobility group B protein 6-like n=1 Tax=Arachis stenosperma TaxID=217475 RepID=UPI0025ACB250|nr:high mobility group B protein 6-like [Arachis stenosperma]